MGDDFHNIHYTGPTRPKPPEHVTLKVKRLHPAARLPTRAHATDAGLDFYAAEEKRLWPGAITRVATGVAVEIPPGWCLLLWTRSGHARHGLDVRGGCVDSGYTGEVIVMVAAPPGPDAGPNDGHRIKPGDKIAQGLLCPVPQVSVVEVDELAPSDRGADGFGSTGA